MLLFVLIPLLLLLREGRAQSQFDGKMPTDDDIIQHSFEEGARTLGATRARLEGAYRPLSDGTPAKLDKPEFNSNAVAVESFNDFESDLFGPLLDHDRKQLVFFLDYLFMERSFGNSLGQYFEAVSCAFYHGIDFIGIRGTPIDPITSKRRLRGRKRRRRRLHGEDAFMTSLPVLMAHPNASKSSVDEHLQLSLCAGSFPWERNYARWSTPQGLRIIEYIVKRAVAAHLSAQEHHSRQGGPLIDSFDQVVGRPSGTDDEPLPPVPDVALLFRCADVLSHGPWSPYGFLNWNVMSDIISTYTAAFKGTLRTVYILSEPLTYGPFGNACGNITQELVSFLHKRHPQTSFAVRRGHALDSFAMLTMAPLVICPPSSFCLFPAVVGGSPELSPPMPRRVYFQDTALVHGAGRHPDLGRHFIWLDPDRSPLLQFGPENPNDDGFKKVEHYLGSEQGLLDVLETLKAPVP